MPISAPTVLSTNTSVTGTTSLPSGSISPSANALLIAVACAGAGSSSNNHTPMSCADNLSGGSLTWTKRAEVNFNAFQSWSIGIFTAIAGASPGTGAVTITYNSSSTRSVIHVVQVASGFNSSAPIRQANFDSGSSSTLTVTLGSTPLSDSMVVGAVVSRDSPGFVVTPGATFTELVDTVVGTSQQGTLQAQYDLNSAPIGCDWSGLGTSANAGVAIEVAAEIVAKAIPILHRPLRVWERRFF